MADLKISQLTGATTPLAGTEVLPIVQSSSTKKVSVANLTVGRAVDTAGGTFTDNQIQGTAGKGVNFTANTPAAGMASQLLNWYEEGTWTPAQGAGVTVVGSFSSEGTYTRIGRLIVLRGKLTGSTSILVTANTVLCTGLPWNSNAAYSVGSVVNADMSEFGAVIATGATIYSTAISATTDIYFTVSYHI